MSDQATCPCGSEATIITDPHSGRKIKGICQDCAERSVRQEAKAAMGLIGIKQIKRPVGATVKTYKPRRKTK